MLRVRVRPITVVPSKGAYMWLSLESAETCAGITPRNRDEIRSLQALHLLSCIADMVCHVGRGIHVAQLGEFGNLQGNRATEVVCLEIPVRTGSFGTAVS